MKYSLAPACGAEGVSPPSQIPLRQAAIHLMATHALIADETKPLSPCPGKPVEPRLACLGQSNAANHAGQRYRSDYGARVVNFFDTRCFTALSAPSRVDGLEGEYWTLLGNLLIASENSTVVIAPLAFSRL